MAKSKQLTSIKAPEISANVAITRQDLIQLGVAEIERELKEREQQFNAEIKCVEEKLEKLDKLIDQKFETEAKKHFNIEKIKQACEELLGVTPELRSTYFANDNRTVTYVLMAEAFCPGSDRTEDQSQRGSERLHLLCMMRQWYTQLEDVDVFALRRCVADQKIPSAIVKKQQEQEALQRRKEVLRTQCYEIKVKLNELNSYERQLNAQLTKEVLSSTEQGRQLLDQLDISGILKELPKV